MSDNPRQDKKPSSKLNSLQNKQEMNSPQKDLMPQNKEQISFPTKWQHGYPRCINNGESRLVCLYEGCQKYPFFCSNCEDQSCELQHQHHENKITSIGFKELIKKLITQRKPSENLTNAVQSYMRSLQDLRQNVNKFVEYEKQNMRRVLEDSIKIDKKQQQTIKKLREKQYKSLTGKQLDQVWKSAVPNQEKKEQQSELIQFIKSKQEQVHQLTETFSNIQSQKGEKTNEANNQLRV